MKIKFTSEHMDLLRKAGVKSPAFHSDTYAREREIESHHIAARDLPVIQRELGRLGLNGDTKAKAALRKLKAAENAENASPEKKIGRLEALSTALRKVLADVPRHWIFLADENEHPVPWYVTNIEHNPSRSERGHVTPANVEVDLVAMIRGDRKTNTLRWGIEHLPATVAEAMSQKDMVLATPELLAEYDELRARYEKECDDTGVQYLAEGVGSVIEDESKYWRRAKAAFGRPGELARVIMDDEDGREDDTDVAEQRFWTGQGRDADEEAEAAERDPALFLPAHPIVRVFNLASHEFMEAHFSCFKPYVYDKTVINKIVLPEANKALIDALTNNVIENMSDMIRGKAQGMIVICSGEPGTGKTLTAEVYSEATERPLYTVQCSQLGTDEVELEKRLGVVLERATRWNAVLLIDESDVYIHERGGDIHQNAVVGVFLRLLEYYNGLMFLNTNRATVIDDAIMSRATAHVRYGRPVGQDRQRLWKILFAQYEVKASAQLVEQAVKAFPSASGRTMRQLIRLGLILAKSAKKPFAFSFMETAAAFNDDVRGTDEADNDFAAAREVE